MYIRYIRVKNFRGISEVVAYMNNNLICIVGQNDVGKSSLLQAIRVLLENEKIGLEDFQKGNEATSIEIEIHFESIGLDHLKHNGLIKLKHVYKKNDQKLLSEKLIFSDLGNMDLDELSNYSTLKSVAKKLEIETSPKKPSDEELSKLRKQVVEVIESSPKEDWVEINWEDIKKNLPEVLYIPASQDHENEQKMSNDSSLFGKLFRVGVRNWLKADPESKSAMETIHSKVEMINNHILKIVERKLKEQLPLADSLSQDVDPLDVSKGFSFTMQVKDEHGVETPLSKRGSGLQRSVLVAVIRAQNEVNGLIERMKPHHIVSEAVEGSDICEEYVKPTLYIFEEPEAFLHLSAQKDLYYSLKDLTSHNSQVVITTHSTLFIDESEMNDVVLLIREQGKTIARQHIPVEEIKDYLGERVKLSELLVGKVCCLVEGLSDKFAFEKWAHRLGYDIKRQGIHFISMDGCQNMDYFANVSILHDFNVPFKIVLDNDTHGETNSIEKIRFLKEKIPRLKNDCFVLLKKGELENYFCVDTVAAVLKIPRELINDGHYLRDPKEELKSATKKSIEAGSKIARRYKETEHSRVIAERMPLTTIDEEIAQIIKDLIEQVEENAKAIQEIQKGLAEVAAGK